VGVAYALWMATLLHAYRPRTPAAVLEVARFGKVTSVTANRHLPDTRNEVQQKARKYAKEGLTDKAAECYRYLLRLTPDSFACNLEYGELLMTTGETTPAQKYLERSLKLQPTSFDANLAMARALFKANRPEEALTYAQRAHAGGVPQPAETKELASLYRDIGSFYFDRGRWDDAIALFNRADRRQNQEEIQYLLARCYIQRGLVGAGTLRRAGAFLGLTSGLDDESRRRAEQHLQRCLELNPLHEGARKLRNEALR